MGSLDSKALIHLELCNNITSCDIGVVRGSLNIKYAINGTGKSTIAKAILLASQQKSLAPLMPFQLPSGSPESTLPSASGVEFKKVMLFDGDYIRQYIFQPSDLVKDAFEIFLRSADYDTFNSQIIAYYKNIAEMFTTSSEIQLFLENLRKLCDLVKTKGDGTISRRAKGIKNVLEQQKCSIESYPAGLSEFEPFFSDEEKALDWTAWKLVGIDKYYGKGLCPFCAGVETEEAAAQTQLFSKSFDKDSVIFTSKLKEYILELKLYIDPERLKSLLGLLSADGDRAIFSRELEKIIAEAKYIRDQLQGLATFSGLSIDMNRLSELIEILTAMKIDVRLDYFNTSSFQEKIEPVNKKIDEITKTVSRLQESIAQLHACLNSQIRKRKDDINEFLKSAGFKYSFDIKVDGDGLAHALLLFNGSDETHIPVENPSEHLSWGERNVVSLLLFMFDAISKDSDLIILDDPISSFDSNKKYAIINRLFITGRREDSLYMRTVLLLTHDLEPVIDYIQVGGKLDKKFVNGSFVQNTGGAVVEFPIEKDKDILSTTILMKEIARDETVQISARIGCLRKYIEYTVANPLSDSIPYNILSSLIHGRKHPTYDSDGERDMSPEDTQTGSDEIKEFIPSFEYSTALDHFDRRVLLKEFQEQSNMYIKLLILRAYVQCYPEAKARLTAKNDVLRKYLDETFHVENDYLYSFDLRRFAIVPEYISEVAADFVSLECSI